MEHNPIPRDDAQVVRDGEVRGDDLCAGARSDGMRSDDDMNLAREHFLDSIRRLGNVSLLLRRIEGGYEVAEISRDMADMMECDSVEEAHELLNGNGIMETTHPDDRLAVKRMLRRRKSKEGTSDLNVRKITARGNMIWCSVHYAFIDDFGEHYVYATYFNVTVLKEYEDRLRTAYVSMGDNFYHTNDRTLGLFRVNLTRNKLEDMQGRSLYATDSLVRPYSEVMEIRSENYPIPEEREKMLRAFSTSELLDAYSRGRLMVSQILFSKRRDGRFCYVKLEATFVRHPMSGDVIAFITESECNNEKVNETLLSKILARQFDMVCFLANGEYGVVVGDASLIEKGNIFPLKRNGDYTEWLENQVIPVLDGTDEEQDRQADSLELETIEEKLAAGEPYVANIACRIDGEVFYKRFDFFLVNPEARFYILLKSDTTEIQREQIERNEQLQLALREAEAASVAKTAFLSRMSHEIRTPMNAIIGLDNIALQEDVLSADARDHLEKIGSSARYLLSLINDILDMSRIESGRMTIKAEEFEFGSLLESVNTMADGQCRDKGLHYDCKIHGQVDECYVGDDTKIRQVLINILGNAVKFTPEGGTVSLDVERTSIYGDQATVKFEIRDTGIGMDESYLPRIFDVFSQEDDTNTSRYGGSGLGMAITKNIVELMNGRIQVESEKGAGTTFVVTIPMKTTGRSSTEGQNYELKPDELKKKRLAETSVEIKPAELSGRRVLLAEDVLINAEIMKQMLLMNGIDADHAENGREAVEMMRSHPAGYYDVILMDIRMPVMDGLEAAEKIRVLDHPDAKDIPIIAMTANAFDEDVQRSLQAGMNAHLSKPIEPDLLFDTISDMIARRSLPRKG